MKEVLGYFNGLVALSAIWLNFRLDGQSSVMFLDTKKKENILFDRNKNCMAHKETGTDAS